MEFNNVIEIEIVQELEETVNKSAVLIENGVPIVKKSRLNATLSNNQQGAWILWLGEVGAETRSRPCSS